MDYFMLSPQTHSCSYIRRHNRLHTSPSLWLEGCQATPRTSACLRPCNLFLWRSQHTHTHAHTHTHTHTHNPILFNYLFLRCQRLASEVGEVTQPFYLCLSKLMALPKGEVWKENRNFTGHQMTAWSFPTRFLDRHTGQRNLGPYWCR